MMACAWAIIDLAVAAGIGMAANVASLRGA
jgi:hypothetical protein